MTTATSELEQALSRAANGLYSTEAAVRLIIATGMAHRLQFAVEMSDGPEPMAWIDWETVMGSGLWSGGERRILTIAHKLFTGDLDLAGLSPRVVEAVVDAVVHAAGLHDG